MRYLYLIAFTTLYFSCNTKKQTSSNELLKQMMQLKDPMEAYVPDSLKYLIPILDTVFVTDQEYRYGMNQRTGKDSMKMMQEFVNHLKEINATTAKNIKIVSEILDKYGWLGFKDVGMRGSLAIFYVIQHADLKTQEKFLPLIKTAVAQKKAAPPQYAMLYDRIELRNHRPQMYGTQVGDKEVEPLLSPDSVDSWRKSIGMDSLKYYLKGFKLQWNKEEYKKVLPELKKKYKVLDF
ncbi:MAG TPA: DUF6624 domain-containing protein [Chitinophagaceae bacterium]|nr:DUF6624 domain-containing protein [Chitinophagaceae bacterium]